MDLHMPRMNGCETGLAIRKLPGRAEIPIIILTADATSSAREQCLRAGMNDIVTKPINTREFFRALERWLNADGSADKKGKENIKQREEETKTEIRQTITGDKLTLLDNPIILQVFVNTHGETVKHICQALADADQKEAHRLAHNLKSAAGTVKAEQLCQQARQLEEFFSRPPAEDGDTAANRAMNDAIPPLLDQTKKEISCVLDQIHRCISGD
jgi:DNA-binding response OmpR family regulator